MKALKWTLLTLLVLIGLALAAGQAGLLQGRPPADLGVRDGKLKPPSPTPNSVSSQAALWPDHPQHAAAQIAPLALSPAGDGPATIARLKGIVAALPGARVVDSRPDYLYAQFTTKWMHFVDDVEFWFDPAAGAIQVRSASRLGSEDMNVNRQRVETIRQRLGAAP
jgi:uncharacterized protein (DUF1499 family)